MVGPTSDTDDCRSKARRWSNVDEDVESKGVQFPSIISLLRETYVVFRVFRTDSDTLDPGWSEKSAKKVKRGVHGCPTESPSIDVLLRSFSQT